MLDAFSCRNIRPKHIVLSSSRAVYGEGAWRAINGDIFYPEGRTPAMLTAGEWDPVAPDGSTLTALRHNSNETQTRPISIYGATKLTQEHILKAWCAAHEVPLTILRFQNVYGPGQSPFNSYTGIVTIFHRQAATGEQIKVYEDGRIVRDFVFIDDATDALVASIANTPVVNRTIDVGTGVPVTIYQAACMIANLYNAPPPTITGQYRNGDVRSACCDPEPLRHALAVSARVPFTEGSRRVAQWLSEQKL
jgi:dTDP-L-rhamnose 4-epimerase